MILCAHWYLVLFDNGPEWNGVLKSQRHISMLTGTDPSACKYPQNAKNSEVMIEWLWSNGYSATSSKVGLYSIPGRMLSIFLRATPFEKINYTLRTSNSGPRGYRVPPVSGSQELAKNIKPTSSPKFTFSEEYLEITIPSSSI